MEMVIHLHVIRMTSLHRLKIGSLLCMSKTSREVGLGPVEKHRLPSSQGRRRMRASCSRPCLNEASNLGIFEAATSTRKCFIGSLWALLKPCAVPSIDAVKADICGCCANWFLLSWLHAEFASPVMTSTVCFTVRFTNRMMSLRLYWCNLIVRNGSSARRAHESCCIHPFVCIVRIALTMFCAGPPSTYKNLPPCNDVASLLPRLRRKVHSGSFPDVRTMTSLKIPPTVMFSRVYWLQTCPGYCRINPQEQTPQRCPSFCYLGRSAVT